jgi:hypothetical protein
MTLLLQTRYSGLLALRGYLEQGAIRSHRIIPVQTSTLMRRAFHGKAIEQFGLGLTMTVQASTTAPSSIPTVASPETARAYLEALKSRLGRAGRYVWIPIQAIGSPTASCDQTRHLSAGGQDGRSRDARRRRQLVAVVGVGGSSRSFRGPGGCGGCDSSGADRPRSVNRTVFCIDEEHLRPHPASRLLMATRGSASLARTSSWGASMSDRPRDSVWTLMLQFVGPRRTVPGAIVYYRRA